MIKHSPYAPCDCSVCFVQLNAGLRVITARERATRETNRAAAAAAGECCAFGLFGCDRAVSS